MPTLPCEILAVLMPFSPLFSSPTFTNIQLLFVGAILTQGQRTIASCLRSVGLEQERHFTNFHRVLNRSPWSAKEGARLLFLMIIRFLVPAGPILLGLDDTIERRRGEKIKAKGIYRDPVRSSHGHFVKCSGLRLQWTTLALPDGAGPHSFCQTSLGAAFSHGALSLYPLLSTTSVPVCCSEANSQEANGLGTSTTVVGPTLDTGAPTHRGG